MQDRIVLLDALEKVARELDGAHTAAAQRFSELRNRR
jgi:hypothetical protein